MNHKPIILVFISVILVGVFSSIHSQSVQAKTSVFIEEKVQINSEDEVLNGTILIPNHSESHAGIVLVHGAGAHNQNTYRKFAEAFAEAGIGVLVYDKRTVGYSAEGVGENSRSYALLAEDVLAATEVLHSRAGIDSAKVGLWGESEGASVALLAASRSPEVAFVITVGANGVTPIQQTSWHLENMLRYQGVTADSFIDAVTRKGLRFALSAEMFAEATFQIVPVLERVQQPLLALWGQYDRNSPPVESARVFQQTLQHNGNENYTLQFIPVADHTLCASPDGFRQTDNELAHGTMEGMVSWVNNIATGAPLGPSVIGPTPLQARTSDAAVNEPTLFDSVWLHLTFIITLVILFVSYVSVSVTMKIRKQSIQPMKPSIRWLMRVLSVMGLVTTIGLYIYIMYMIVSHDASFIVFGRPLIWLLLQIFAWIVSILTLLLTIFWWQNRLAFSRQEKLRVAALFIGGILFIPWASHWQLLINWF